jgi:hypothetical protein
MRARHPGAAREAAHPAVEARASAHAWRLAQSMMASSVIIGILVLSLAALGLGVGS